MKQIPLILIAILSFNCQAQITFEKGYFINNKNEKIICLIENMDWNNNPTEFKFKLNESSQSRITNIQSVKEFCIYNNSKYLRSVVNIDRSSESITRLSNKRNPIFKKEELFLKILVAGKSNLYQYTEGNLQRYFYTKATNTIEQLVFKSYARSDHTVGKNNRFKQQLLVNLKCKSIKRSTIESVKYNKSDLVRFFSEYNSCHNVNFINFQPKQKRDLFNLTIRPRLNNSSLTIQNSFSNQITDFERSIEFGFGLEAEFILPFHKNKWGIVFEPTYQNYRSINKRKNVDNISGGLLIAKVKYSSVEIPISLRHYFFLNKKSKIFINASFILDVSSNSSIEFTRADDSSLERLDIVSRNNFGLGIGYKQNKRYSLEIRYKTAREILSNYSFWSSDYNTFSIIFGYTIF